MRSRQGSSSGLKVRRASPGRVTAGSSLLLAAVVAALWSPGLTLGAQSELAWAKGFRQQAPERGASAPAPAAQNTQRASRAGEGVRGAVHANYGRLPLSFEANQGQTDPRVDFVARGRGYTLFLTRNQAVVALARPGDANQASEAQRETADSAPGNHGSARAGSGVFRMRLLNANPARVVGAGELPGRSNYFMGRDSRQWRTNIPNYGRVEYSAVYPGVDLVYYGSQGELEYDFRLAPGANPNAIALAVGADSGTDRTGEAPLELADHGDLMIATAAGEIRLHKPVAYQLGPKGTRKAVPVEYVVKTAGSKSNQRGSQIAFKVGTYDRSLPLVIDPVLTYSTFLGGSNTDVGYAIAVDASGNAYVAGATASTDFQGASRGPCPTCGMNQGGSYDVFVAKLNSAGTALLYSTYVGGSGADQAAGIALDPSGDAYITGRTDSDNFPTTTGAYQTVCGGPSGPSCTSGVYDAFITKLNSSGTALLYSTYLGGSTADQGYGIAVDSSGNAYVAGPTTSATTFPITAGAFQTTYGGGIDDAFVTELNPAGNGSQDLVYSTFLGGAGADQAEGIALDSAGDVFVAGQTGSAAFPTTTGAYDTTCGTDGNCNGANNDAFLSELSLAGTGHSDLLYSTYLGGSSTDEAKSVAVDSAGNVYVTGDTLSSDFPTAGAFQFTPGGGLDAFVTKLKPAGGGLSDLVYSTYLGGSDDDQGNMIVVDGLGNAYVAGLTTSANFPVTSGALQPACGTDGTCNGGLNDAFVSVLSADGLNQIYSTFLGGANDDEAFGLAVDASGIAYVTGSTTSRGSSTPGQGFPVATGAFQTSCGTDGNCDGTSDAFVAKLDLGPAVSLSHLRLDFGQLAVGSSSAAQVVTLTDNGVGALSNTNVAITGAQSSQFSESTTCGAMLAANGGSCTISVTFKPTAVGLKNANLTITDNASDSPQNVPLTGGGSTEGSIQLAPATLSFGNQLVGTSSASQPVTMTNTGLATITITSIAATAPFSETDNCDGTLPAGAACTINVTFTPTTSGAQSGTLTVTDDDSPPTQTVSLSGTGTQAQVTFTPTSLNFGNQVVGTTSAAMTVMVTNSGTGSLTITSIAVGGTNNLDFAETNTCVGSVTITSCTITVTFTPTAAGARSAALMVTDNAPGSPQSVPLSGTGTNGPAVTLSPTSLTFDNQAVGTSSPPMNVTLTNSGTASLTITSITVTGSNSTDFTQTNTCVSPVGAGKSCTIMVIFTPTASGSRSATLSVADDAPGSPQTVALSGTGTAPAVTFSPTSLSFGDQNVNTTSPAQAVTLTNSGTADLSISGITVTGTNSSDFPQTNTCLSLVPAGGNCTITVNFKPSAGGARSASISVADNAAGSPQAVGLSGNGVTVPQVMLAPNSVAFGGQNVGTSSTAMVVTLTNTGTATLNLTSIAIGGVNAADFVQTNTCGTTVGAGKNCTISVTFTPAAGGSRSAALMVTDNAAGSPQTVPLSGSGKDFTISASPGSIGVNPGVTANYTVTLKPVGGFDETVQVSCSGAPSESKCTPTPASPTLDGSSSTSVAVAVTTTAPSAAPPARRMAPPPAPSGKPLGTPALWLAALGLLGALSLVRRRRPWALLAVAGLSVMLWASCGSSSSSGGGGGKSGGTPPGNYTLTITAIGGNQTHTTMVTLTVQ
ncbi:MAG TPA: choice-of-anchor D domain-containing protein [Terriglobia bacterium]|nr:choice-of-anchor D domain-containing protein [Terriglobia bacterium]